MLQTQQAPVVMDVKREEGESKQTCFSRRTTKDWMTPVKRVRVEEELYGQERVGSYIRKVYNV